MPKTITFLNYRQWVDQFTPVTHQGAPKLHQNDSMLSAVRLAPLTNIWSLLSEGEDLFIVNGARYVNLLGYYITAKAWDDTMDYQVDLGDV